MQTLTVPGTLDSLDAIAQYVKSVAAAAGLDNKTTYKLRLAVDEIATNIIVYGYEQAGHQGVLDLQAEIGDRSLTIAIEDTGAAFDPLQKVPLEEASIHKPMLERPIGGLGIYLAVQGLDKFTYERAGDRNRNIFVVNKTPT
jgi:serine/threonine-protein kinase RsbW